MSPPSSAATAAEATQATWIIHPVHAVNKRGNQQILVCSVYPRGLQPPRAHAYAFTPGKKDVQLPSPAQPSVRELIGPQALVASAVPVNLNETRRLVGLATPARAEVIVGFGYFDYVAHNVLDGVNFGKKGSPLQSRVLCVALAVAYRTDTAIRASGQFGNVKKGKFIIDAANASALAAYNAPTRHGDLEEHVVRAHNELVFEAYDVRLAQRKEREAAAEVAASLHCDKLLLDLVPGSGRVWLAVEAACVQHGVTLIEANGVPELASNDYRSLTHRSGKSAELHAEVTWIKRVEGRGLDVSTD